MATSSIGKPVVLSKEAGKKLAKVCKKPVKMASSTSKPLSLSSTPIDATRFK